MLWQRVIASIVGIPLLLYSFYRGDKLLLIVVIILTILALGEFNKIIKKICHVNLFFPLLLSGIIIPVLSLEQDIIITRIALFALALVCLLNFVYMFPKYTIEDLGFTFLGIIYVVTGFTHVLLMRSLDNGFLLITYVFLIIWSTDTGAYFVGILFGKKKLSPQLSPNKTWEGSIGGLIFSFIVIFLYLRFIKMPEGIVLLYITPVISIAAQVGDLFESAIKRFANIKDSGNVIPGHGGVLDRFDSALWAVPTAYYLVLFLERTA